MVCLAFALLAPALADFYQPTTRLAPGLADGSVRLPPVLGANSFQLAPTPPTSSASTVSTWAMLAVGGPS